MIALDTSAVVAIALAEPEEDAFSRLIAVNEALIGIPTLLETRMVLSSTVDDPDRFMQAFISPPEIHPVAFTLDMYHAAVEAFDSFGKGRGQKPGLNFGDCMAYAVAKVHNVPLLYKGADFALTDIKPALP
jgi:ribonuclease VapC